MGAAAVLLAFLPGLAILLARRRSAAILLLAAQGAVLGGLAIAEGGHPAAALAILLGRAALLPGLLGLILAQTREPRPIAPPAPALGRLAFGAGAALLAALAVPDLGLAASGVEAGAAASVALGIAIVAARRPLLFQLLGILVAENGVILLAISIPSGMPLAVELGALLDLMLIVTVGAAYARRIHGELGSGDADRLRGLRD